MFLRVMKGQLGVILGQLGSRRSHLGLTEVMWGQGGSKEEKLGRSK